MLSQWTFKLQELPAAGREWSLEIPRAVFEDRGIGNIEPPTQLCRDVSFNGNISLRGELYRLEGKWHIELIRQCVRCNVDFAMPMDGELIRYYQLGSPGREDDSDSCEFLAPPGHLNLLDVLREELWLQWQPVVICKADCKGLCPKCGENLNERECNCAQQDEDHPFAALKNIRFDT